MLLLSLIACTGADPVAAPPPVAAPAPAPRFSEVHRPLCATPLGCGLLAHYSLTTVESSLCDWCGEDVPGLCGSWLPSAPGSEQPRCSIYLELERCILQHSSTTRFADLPAMAQANILALQERADQPDGCVTASPPAP